MIEVPCPVCDAPWQLSVERNVEGDEGVYRGLNAFWTASVETKGCGCTLSGDGVMRMRDQAIYQAQQEYEEARAWRRGRR